MRGTMMILAIGLCILTSCEKPNQPAEEIVELFYTETHCANPWPRASNDYEKSKIIESYLNQLGVEPKVVWIFYGCWTPEPCLACGCRTGNKVIIEVPYKHVQKLKAVGFE